MLQPHIYFLRITIINNDISSFGQCQSTFFLIPKRLIYSIMDFTNSLNTEN